MNVKEVVWSSPVGTWRLYNVEATWRRYIDVGATLPQRRVPAGWLQVLLEGHHNHNKRPTENLTKTKESAYTSEKAENVL